MCGITGVVRLRADAARIDTDGLVRTRDAMAARGPDGQGLWLEPGGRAALAHRRLAVIDLSEGGSQPMVSSDERFVIVINGEIYNFGELRAELSARGVRFGSQSDTEVVLALFRERGTGMFERLRGMYALGLWDRREQRLLLARDPLGIKPLYYGVRDGCLYFASQVKALESSTPLGRGTDAGAVCAFLMWGSVPEPLTLRPDIRSVPAGHWIAVQDGHVSDPVPFQPPEEQRSEDDLRAALVDSVRAHTVADVPVAVFLSAGLDSALVTSLVRNALREPPVTLTLGFEALRGTPWDETSGAAAVARRLGTRHVEHWLDAAALRAAWSDALARMDQPTIDGFNVYLVCRAARAERLKVALCGLGGDELLGGYPSFRQVPRWTREVRALRLVPGLRAAWPYVARRFGPAQPKLAGLLEHGGTFAGAYFLKRGLFLPGELPGLVGQAMAEEGLAAHDPVEHAAGLLHQQDAGHTAWEKVHELETRCYLRNQLLRDADWAAMAHSIELRVPLADAHLYLLARKLRFQPAQSMGKRAFVRSMLTQLPAEVDRRPKSGFMVPSSDGPVSDWGGNARLRALKVLRAFGVDLAEAGAARVEKQRASRGSTG